LGFSITFSEYFAHVKKVEPHKSAFFVVQRKKKVASQDLQKNNAGAAAVLQVTCKLENCVGSGFYQTKPH
jgi:hypothetical protein